MESLDRVRTQIRLSRNGFRAAWGAVLLVLVILLSPVGILGKGRILALPHAAMPKLIQFGCEDHLTVRVSNHPQDPFRWWVEKEKYTRGQFREALADSFRLSPERKVIVEADRGLPWGEVRKVLQVVREAGFQKVALRVEPLGWAPFAGNPWNRAD